MKVLIKRFADNGDTTLGALYINGIFKCFTVEDEERKGAKVQHETRVPNGIYNIGLRTEGGFHEKFKVKFPAFHKGMLCIYNAPDWKIVNDGKTFQFILIHTGNTDEHTSGCLLLNYGVDGKKFIGSDSVGAYSDVYPIILKALQNKESVSIEYTDVEDGK
jgi:hypothetical protein